MSHLFRRVAVAVGLVLLSGALSGCVFYEGRGGGWCWWHPYACR